MSKRPDPDQMSESPQLAAALVWPPYCLYRGNSFWRLVLTIALFLFLPKAYDHSWRGYCWSCSNLPDNHPLCFTLICVKDPATLLQLTHNQKGEIHHFPAENHGLRLAPAHGEGHDLMKATEPHHLPIAENRCWGLQPGCSPPHHQHRMCWSSSEVCLKCSHHHPMRVSSSPPLLHTACLSPACCSCSTSWFARTKIPS